jgi:hypothetical protein
VASPGQILESLNSKTYHELADGRVPWVSRSRLARFSGAVATGRIELLAYRTPKVVEGFVARGLNLSPTDA